MVDEENNLRILLDLLQKNLTNKLKQSRKSLYPIDFTEYVHMGVQATRAGSVIRYVFYLTLPKMSRHCRYITDKEIMIKKLQQFIDVKEFHPAMIEKWILDHL